MPVLVKPTKAGRKRTKPKAKMPRRKVIQALKRALMRAWECHIRSLSQVCVSGRPNHGGPIQAAHGFSRRYSNTALNTANGFPICRDCHMYFTVRPQEWTEWMLWRLGADAYADLKRRRDGATGPGFRWTFADLSNACSGDVGKVPLERARKMLEKLPLPN